MTVEHNRESARTTDPETLANKIARIRQILDHNRRARYARLTTPLDPDAAFDLAEVEEERRRFGPL